MERPVSPWVSRTATVSSLIGVARTMSKVILTCSGFSGSKTIPLTRPTCTPRYFTAELTLNPETDSVV